MTLYAGQRLRVSDLTFPATGYGPDVSVTTGTTTSTTFTNTLATSGIRGCTFFGGPSGVVKITAQCHGATNSLGAFVLISSEIKTGAVIGSGTLIASSDENTAAALSDDPASQIGWLCQTRIITGLTNGSQYNVVLTYRTTAGTGTFGRRSIIAEYQFG